MAKKGWANLERGAQDHCDQGFTLIELLITITILPLVIGAISVGLLSVFSLQSGVSNRLSNSSDAQMVSVNFAKDVQSSELITTQTSSSPQCGSGTQLLGLQWDSGQTVVSYVSLALTAGSTTTYSLVRQYCTLGNMVTPASTSTVSYGLSSSQGPPTVSCPSPAAPSCAASTQWIAAAGVLTVTFTIIEPASSYTYTLVATPRIWQASGGVQGGGLPYAPVTLLDPSSCTALDIGQGKMSINVGSGTGNGILDVVSSCAGTVKVSNGGDLAASSVVTADQGLNSIYPNSNATYPSTEYYSNQFSNPFASLTPPASPTGPSATCTSSGTTSLTYTCPAGVYSSPPSFSGTTTVTINFSDTGTYYFPQGLVIPNNVTVNFSSGTYIFDGSTALSTGSNVTISGSSVLFYIGSGAVTLGNNGSISLSALSGYDDIAIWDAVNPGIITVGDNSNVSSDTAINGGIYMPQGLLKTGSNVTISATFLVVATATFGNNVNLTITSP